jgi:CHASE3 domain sensor protein
MQKLSVAALFAGIVSMTPAVASAQVTLAHTLGQVSGLINGLIPIVLAIAVLIFFWGLAMYMFNTNNLEKRTEGINIMFMGIIAIFVMVSLWGIIRILQQTFKVDQSQPIVPAVIQRGYN